MTAEQLNALVSLWPVGARPKCVRYDWNDFGPKHTKRWHGSIGYLDVSDAESLHIASGLAWLASNATFCVCVGHTRPFHVGDVWTVQDGATTPAGLPSPRVCFHRSTLIHAIHAAVMAVSKEQGNAG